MNDVDALCSGFDATNYDGPSWGIPDEWVDPLRDAVRHYRREFEGDEEAQAALTKMESHAIRLVEALNERYADTFAVPDGPATPPRPAASPLEDNMPPSARDPFDDVDAS